ncbi:DUF4870 domain-containing protein [Brevibacillus migulae]|uniref:DUF4870 domain-containing protein n=1 Tax=Brevibacillus migulae TaxID=1644114 RepID=UPI00106E45A6|nr:DUF4870 domain-containing protein [Brevibacillus migulae]
MESYLPSKDERLWAMIAHLSALSGFIIPFGNALGPLIIWLIKREEMPFVNQQGKEALNFGISVTIYAAISYILVFILVGVVALIALFIFWLVVVIIAAVRTNEGKAYRYPLCIRLVK